MARLDSEHFVDSKYQTQCQKTRRRLTFHSSAAGGSPTKTPTGISSIFFNKWRGGQCSIIGIALNSQLEFSVDMGGGEVHKIGVRKIWNN